MSFKKFISVILFSLCTVWMLSAFTIEFGSSDSSDIREPDSTKRRSDDYVGVIIKTKNVEDAEVYINGKLFGETPVATVDLSATTYDLEIRKKGYDTIKCRIRPKRYYTYTYIFEMQKTCGYITVQNVPSGAAVYINGSKYSSFPVEVEPGNHTVKVRKFGYEELVEKVYVENHVHVRVNVILTPADFAIRDFKLSKNVINPDYSSAIGRTEISFYVTNDGSAIVSVNDRYGNALWSHKFESFNTWEQSITWNGCNSEGEALPDGTYTVSLISYVGEYSATVKIDRSLNYPVTAFTPSGSGVGTLPCAFASTVGYGKLTASLGPGVLLSDNSFSITGLPITSGLQFNFAKHWEIGGSITIIPSFTGAGLQLRAGGSFKGTLSAQILPSLNLNFAGLCNYNYVKNGAAVNGFTAGAAAGLESKLFYTGVSAEYTFGQAKQLKCGAVVSLMPVNSVKVSAWAALYGKTSVEIGGEVISMPASSTISIDVKGYVVSPIENFGKNMSANAQIGLSYLF